MAATTMTRPSSMTEGLGHHLRHTGWAGSTHLITSGAVEKVGGLTQDLVAAAVIVSRTRQKRLCSPLGQDIDSNASKRMKLRVAAFPTVAKHVLVGPTILPNPHVRLNSPVDVSLIPIAKSTTIRLPCLGPGNATSPTVTGCPPPITRKNETTVNGIKQELDRRKQKDLDRRTLGRKLRSQEATRFKSVLSAYFPDYDEVIGNDPKERHILNSESSIIIVDSSPGIGAMDSILIGHVSGQKSGPNPTASVPIREYGGAVLTSLFDSQLIDFGFLETHYRGIFVNDPLPDILYVPVHKKAQRLERSIRNSEKGRAQHEKDQIVRLLDGLLGHDWLRIMGVSGITDSRKKAFEPARQYFVKGCQVILDKFRWWSMEERKRKSEKDIALAELEDADENNEADGDGPLHIIGTTASPSTDSDDESSLGIRLHDGSLCRSVKSSSRSRQQTPTHPRQLPDRPRPPDPCKELISFFAKRHERDSALHPGRRGRKVMAWGHVIPSMSVAEFVLPFERSNGRVVKTRDGANASHGRDSLQGGRTTRLGQVST